MAPTVFGMSNASTDDIIDRIYEASVIPELWPSALDLMADAADCQVGFLFAVDGASEPQSIVNDRGQEAARRFFEDGWVTRNTQGARTLARDEPRFISDHDIYTEAEIENDPYYREFLRPNGLAWGCGTVISGPVPNRIMISIHRPYECGPLDPLRVARLTKLRPAIARAAFMAARLRLERAQTAVGTLELMGLPAAALSRRGNLQIANSLFDRLLPSIASDGPHRLRLISRDADRLFAEALGEPRASGLGRTIPVPGREEGPPAILHLIPVAGMAHDIFGSGDWLLVAIPVKPDASVSPMVLQGLFDLTPAEVRVAKGLLAGRDLGEIARAAGLSKETVRTQLKSTMAKTGVRRQAELVGLLGGTLRPFGILPDGLQAPR